ncbi:thioesterase family protein [Cryomorphaceae bacterium]|nr:thioesterase family protein [Cryomorphaceae bacterium]
MNPFETTVQFRWSDLDPNFHVRHSVYYDICAQLRTVGLGAAGFTLEFFAQNKIGPVLFREECTFRREIRFGDTITVDLQALKLAKNGGRFSFVHHFKRGEDLVATLVVDGAFIDTEKRKLTTPPEHALPMMDRIPKAEGFEWT